MITHIQLCDIESGGVFYDKLRFIYVQFPLFKKLLHNIDNRLEKWLFLLQRLQHLEKDVVENNFVEPLFEEVVHLAEVANMSKEQKLIYDVSWKRYNDYHNTIDYAKQSGLEKGIEKGIEIERQQGLQQGREEGLQQGIKQGELEKQITIAKNMLNKNTDISFIAEVTGLSITQIKNIKT